MAALQGIKRRIRSVSNTRQITKAMQLVSASKLRRAQDEALAPQAYTDAARELLRRLGASVKGLNDPLYQSRPVNKGLMIVVAGDRGLAGGYNANVLKAMSRHAMSLDAEMSAICIGRRAAAQVARLSDVDEIAAYETDTPGDADTVLARPVLAEAIEMFLSGQADAVHLVYTRFHSTVRQEVVVSQLLPVSIDAGEPIAEAELEPSAEVLLEYATRRLLEAEILQAILNARASEQAARMMAMMKATDNAGELIEDLTLSFNEARQSAITSELAEISAGAEAINQSGNGV